MLVLQALTVNIRSQDNLAEFLRNKISEQIRLSEEGHNEKENNNNKNKKSSTH